jgi:hypothetical protein
MRRKRGVTSSGIEDVDWKGLEASFRGIAERSIAFFSTPRFPPKLLTSRIGIPQTTLTNWLSKGEFELDADRNRRGRETRLFSARDAVLLAAAAEFVAVGVPLGFAKDTAHRICDQIMHWMGSPQMMAPGSELIIYRAANEWHVVPKSSAPDKLPALHLEFDIVGFAKKVLDELGVTMVAGTADDFPRASDAQKKPN